MKSKNYSYHREQHHHPNGVDLRDPLVVLEKDEVVDLEELIEAASKNITTVEEFEAGKKSSSSKEVLQETKTWP